MGVALIAGEGSLPEVIASRLASNGEKPFVYAMRETCDEFAPHAAGVVQVFRTDLASTLMDMTSKGVRKVMFAGVVPKTLMYNAAMQDELARKFVASLSSRDDHSLLGGIVALFEKSGFEVIGYHDIVEDHLAEAGHIAGRETSSVELEDVRYGVEIAKCLVPLSFGQSVIVNRRSVVAVEAMEGTDATIVRAGSICKGGVLVKMMKGDQDFRYDIPTVGTQTLHLMSRAGISCLALHSGRTLIMARGEFAKFAEESGIAVVGFEA